MRNGFFKLIIWLAELNILRRIVLFLIAVFYY